MKRDACPIGREIRTAECADDGIVVLGRTDGAPLRFRGGLLVASEQDMAGARLELTLWRRAGGGFAVSARYEDSGPEAPRCRRSFAATADTVEAAMRILEEVSLVGEAPVRGRRREARGTAEAAAGRCFDLGRQATLRAVEDDLRGEALAAWALLVDAEIC